MARTPRSEAEVVKVVSLGPAASGKSSLIKRYSEQKFVEKHISTIGVDYGVKKVELNGAPVKIQFWDLAGKPEFLEVRNEFYADTQVLLLVFSVADKNSPLTALSAFLEEARKFNVGDPVLVVCANKTDESRVVSEQEGRGWAEAKKALYFETSAKSGNGVSEAFEKMIEAALEK